MREDTRQIVATVAYLIGVKRETWEANYDRFCEGLLQELDSNDNAAAVRCLCRLRTSLIRSFKKTDKALLYDITNIDKLEWFDIRDINTLEKLGVKILLTNKRAEDYSIHFNKLINEKIGSCRQLFPDWIKWEYIKSLFMLPKYTKKEVQRYEFEKYMANMIHYPYKCYIVWEPSDVGNLLYTDGKFLEKLYEMNNDYFADSSKYKNAVADVKNNIYDFIDDSDKVVLVVDCENSDVYKMYSVLKNLNQDEIAKIHKIMLFDDSHTTNGWDYIDKFIRVPVDHIEVERVTDRKSLVDIKVTAEVCREYYKEDVTSFILLSSDSDYWGLISSLPDAQFLVMIEYEKCGEAIKDALDSSGIYFCSIDDFCSGNIEEFKKAVLINELRSELDSIVGRNGFEVAEQIFQRARIYADTNEIHNFYDRYIKTLRLAFDSEGNISIQLK